MLAFGGENHDVIYAVFLITFLQADTLRQTATVKQKKLSNTLEDPA